MRRVTRWKTTGLLLAALVVFGFGSVGCDRNAVTTDDFTDTETVSLMITQGWQHLEQGDPETAVERFNAAASADAKSLEAYLGLGYAYALMNQPTIAVNNFGNVLALGPVLNYDSNSRIFAETYAGLAAAYLAGGDYANTITNAKLGEAIWETKTASEQVHRYITDFGLNDLKVIRAEAYYGDEDYADALLLVDELSPNFITGSSVITAVTGERAPVSVFETTATDGIARVTLTNGNLIYPQTATIGSADYDVVDFAYAGKTLDIQGSPTPALGDSADVDYLYASDFGLFLIELRNKLDELSQ